MPYAVRYKRAAAAEVEAAIFWYLRPEINQAVSFVQELERTESHLRSFPALYRRVEGMSRTHLQSIGSQARANFHAEFHCQCWRL